MVVLRQSAHRSEALVTLPRGERIGCCVMAGVRGWNCLTHTYVKAVIYHELLHVIMSATAGPPSDWHW